MKAILKNNQGIVMVVVIAMTAILLSLTGAALLFSGLNLKAASNFKTKTGVLHISDAGVNHAWQELANGDGTNDFAAVFGAAGVTTLFSNTSFGSGSYTVTAQGVVGSSPNRVTVTSTGCLPAASPCPSNNSKAVITAEFTSATTGPLFKYAAFGTSALQFSGGGIINSYNSTLGAYGGGNIGSAGHVGSNGNVSIDGTVNGNASAGGTVSGATVTGTVTNGAASESYPPPTACGPPWSDGSGITGGTYSSVTGQLSVSSGSASLANGTYCFSKVQVSGGSTLTVNGPVKINVTGLFDISGGSSVNTTHLAENFAISSSYVPVKGDAVALSGGSDSYMTVYAPAGKVAISGGSDLFGAFVGKQIDISNISTRVHFDEKLLGGGGGGVVLASWKEAF